MEDTNLENKASNPKESPSQIAGAILIVGLIIAGAVLLKDSTPPSKVASPQTAGFAEIKPINLTEDRILGSKSAEVTLVMYEDFNCHWCVKFNSESEKAIKDNFVPTGAVSLVYRDFPFLSPTSFRAAEAGMCAHDQGKFWEFHDVVFTNQAGTSKITLEDLNLKAFAKTAGLDTVAFDQCLDSGKHTEAVLQSKDEGAQAGVKGTPKGFILKDGKVIDTIDGYMTVEGTIQKIEAALD